MRLQLIDLDSASALEVLGIHRSAERKQAGSGRLSGTLIASTAADGKVVRRARPIDVHGSFARRIEAQIPIVRWDYALEDGGQAHAVHPGANVHHLGPRCLRRTVGRAPVEKAKGGVDDPALARAADQVGERDLVRSDVQVSGRVHSVNPEVFDGVAGIDHLRVAVHYILVGPASLARNRKVHAAAPEAVDYTQRRHFRQIHGAVRGQLPLRVERSG